MLLLISDNDNSRVRCLYGAFLEFHTVLIVCCAIRIHPPNLRHHFTMMLFWILTRSTKPFLRLSVQLKTYTVRILIISSRCLTILRCAKLRKKRLLCWLSVCPSQGCGSFRCWWCKFNQGPSFSSSTSVAILCHQSMISSVLLYCISPASKSRLPLAIRCQLTFECSSPFWPILMFDNLFKNTTMVLVASVFWKAVYDTFEKQHASNFGNKTPNKATFDAMFCVKWSHCHDDDDLLHLFIVFHPNGSVINYKYFIMVLIEEFKRFFCLQSSHCLGRRDNQSPSWLQLCHVAEWSYPYLSR